VSNNVCALVVEDDAHNLIAVTAILNELGICYKRNTTGAGVVRQVHGMKPRPDFILLSMDLAEYDPLGIILSLRTDTSLAHIPVIAMGGPDALAMQPKIRAAGCAGFLFKPLPRKHLDSYIRRILTGEQVWQEAV